MAALKAVLDAMMVIGLAIYEQTLRLAGEWPPTQP
jgi:hypothetical protein